MNVYPDDVEAVLNALSWVRSSVVISVNDEVHAVIILRDKTASAEEVIAEANRRLEPYQRIHGMDCVAHGRFPSNSVHDESEAWRSSRSNCQWSFVNAVGSDGAEGRERDVLTRTRGSAGDTGAALRYGTG
jgi:acyl-CoA synthetase (AMP-forming)/AMP-acid ligase II